MPELSLLSYFAVLSITVISLILWRFGRIHFNRQVVISAILALLAFQSLFFLQGSMGLPGPDGPIQNQVTAIFAVVLAFNSVLQILKIMVLEFLVQQNNIKLPRFLIDFLGWLAIGMVLLAILQLLHSHLLGYGL